MMTGQPYKSPEAAPAAEETAATTKTEGTPSTTVHSAVRGVTALSARLRRQRLANQVYKDAWTATDPTLEASISPDELAVVVAAAGLAVDGADLAELVESSSGGITCKCTRAGPKEDAVGESVCPY